MLQQDGLCKHRTPMLCPGTLFRHALRRRSIEVFCALILAICGTGYVAAQEAVDTGESVDAIWHVEAVDLNFRSPETYFHCDNLKTKIARILHAVGAAYPMNISARCLDTFTNNASFRIVFGVPVEATPENIRIETTFNAHSELVARLRNWQLPTPTTIRRFRAAWTTVSFSSRDRLHLRPEDCDLLHDMSEQIFPRLAIRVTKGRLTCMPGSTPLGGLRLEVKALLPLST